MTDEPTQPTEPDAEPDAEPMEPHPGDAGQLADDADDDADPREVTPQ